MDMEMVNQLDITTREAFRQWLEAHAATAKACWLPLKKGKKPPVGMVWYLDAVEEALCFGWIDSTCKVEAGVTLQRFSPRKPDSVWTELNKERCRRLIKLGLMTDLGQRKLPDLRRKFIVSPEIEAAFKADGGAWKNFKSFPELYQRVRIDNIQRVKACPPLFDSRLKKLIEASGRGEMIGEWNDGGRLLDY